METTENRILVLLDGGSRCTDAVRRAALIAAATDLPLDLLWFGERAPWLGLEDSLQRLRSEHTVRLLEPATSLFEALREQWQRAPFGMLVKGCDAHHSGEGLLTPQDWRLLREAPSPVLLVKRSRSWLGGTVLASINPLHDDEAQRALDTAVLRAAMLIAGQTQGRVHSVLATDPPMLGGDPEDQVASLIEDRARRAAERRCRELALWPQQHHIGEGPAAFWIARTVGDQDAVLLVIGTSARQGLRGALLGNTAEDVLDRVDCDVLVLQPGQSPLCGNG